MPLRNHRWRTAVPARHLAGLTLGTALLAACAIPMVNSAALQAFELQANASGSSGNTRVECTLNYRVDALQETLRSSTRVIYRAYMKGSSQRALYTLDESGFAIQTDTWEGEVELSLVFPDTVEWVKLDAIEDGSALDVPFWQQQQYWIGSLQADGSLRGSWLCAPLNADFGSISDDELTVNGVWLGYPLD